MPHELVPFGEQLEKLRYVSIKWDRGDVALLLQLAFQNDEPNPHLHITRHVTATMVGGLEPLDIPFANCAQFDLAIRSLSAAAALLNQ